MLGCRFLPTRSQRLGEILSLRLRHRARRLVWVFAYAIRPEGAAFSGTQFNFSCLVADAVQAFPADDLEQIALCGAHGTNIPPKIVCVRKFIALG